MAAIGAFGRSMTGPDATRQCKCLPPCQFHGCTSPWILCLPLFYDIRGIRTSRALIFRQDRFDRRGSLADNQGRQSL
jgi:hypothetical protein